MTAFDPIINQLGDWNPQIFRELKGKFKTRNVLLFVAIAVMLQIMFIAFFSLLLPDFNPTTLDTVKGITRTSEFCIGQKESASARFFQCSLPLKINWQAWWMVQFRVLSWGLPVLIAGMSGALLAIDIAQESSRGTLNFIRLSPQSAKSILWGKLLGVPALVYLFAFLTLPLHLISAIGGAVNPAFLVSYYLMLGLGYLLLNSFALFIGLVFNPNSGVNQNAIIVGIAVGMTNMGAILGYMMLNLVTTWARFDQYLFINSINANLQWYRLPISKNIWIANLFGIIVVSLVTQAIWTSLERKFNTASRSLFSKRQGYIRLAFCQILIQGLLIRDDTFLTLTLPKFEDKLILLVLINIFNFLAFITLIIALTPQRKIVLDWLRYRHLENNFDPKKRSLWQDLIWHESSPSVGGIAVCGLISALILLPWAMYGNAPELSFAVLAIFISQFLAILIFALIYQALIFWAKNKREQVLAIAIFLGLIIVPAIFLSVTPLPKFIWVIIGYPAIGVIGKFELSFSFLAAILAQIGIMSFLGLRLTRTLKQAAKSDSQHLLQNSSARILNNA